VRLFFIDPGKPMQNGSIESFNGRFREECLDQSWFTHEPGRGTSDHRGLATGRQRASPAHALAAGYAGSIRCRSTVDQAATASSI
jgi:hypothetical protein